ncbi:MAG: hypothetical protein JSW30_03190 [Dehalococcoidia bacterium]|nr:MAG: hypothetical protein JSW30_03190 [Dehalococcoidia bacterium]
MAKKDEAAKAKEQALLADVEEFQRRLGALDQRLDNIDSIVTAVAERVMSQPLALNITCPSCGKNIEITIIGQGKRAV